MAENTPVQGQSKTKSIVCMVLGIVSAVGGWYYGWGIIPAIISLILGGQCKKDGIQNTFTKVGKITAILGIVFSVIGLIVSIIILAVYGTALAAYSYSVG